MEYPINFKDLTKKIKYYDEVINAHKEAADYIQSFYWCKEIKNSSLYTNLGKVLCIFLFDIINSSSDDDNLLWLVVGDLPPMYLDTYGAKNTTEVLENYARLAEDWISQIKTGGGIDGYYPFKAAPTLEMAELLEKKVNQIKHNLIPNIDKISVKLI
jgi:hypothetical protein